MFVSVRGHVSVKLVVLSFRLRPCKDDRVEVWSQFKVLNRVVVKNNGFLGYVFGRNVNEQYNGIVRGCTLSRR